MAFIEKNGRPTCEFCGYELSAMVADNEIPALCECEHEAFQTESIGEKIIMAKEKFWVIRDERTETIIGKHPENEFKDCDEVFQRYCHLPDAFTIYLEKQ